MKVLIVGSEGYLGSVLTLRLREKHKVTGYDMLHLQDVRDKPLIESFCKGKDALIYLASISNNDLCEAKPEFAKSINEDAFPGVIRAAREAGVKRFIYASSVAAYGDSDRVLTESDPLYPTTPYGRGKAYCEDYLKTHPSEMPFIITRSASVCGHSPYMRWDLTVNKMVHDALKTRVITVNGGEQFRCHIHIQDLCEFYALLLTAPIELIQGQAFNVVHKNEAVKETAETVKSMIEGTKIITGPATDERSYQVSGTKANRVLAWYPWRTIDMAVDDINAYG